MKYIYSVLIGFVVTVIIAAFMDMVMNIDASVVNGMSPIIGIVVTIIAFNTINVKTTVKGVVAEGVSYAKSAGDEISSLVEDKDADYYAIAEEEINDGNIDKGLWSQALVKADGDENRRKVEYMKLRVKQLKKEQ